MVLKSGAGLEPLEDERHNSAHGVLAEAALGTDSLGEQHDEEGGRGRGRPAPAASRRCGGVNDALEEGVIRQQAASERLAGDGGAGGGRLRHEGPGRALQGHHLRKTKERGVW